ncbi:MAG: phosphatidylinositol mannoside acyltransferase [Cellulomonadaceae bacterium]|jgi:KDO2-lipid IV(A) lauroyltransferase|nr:phosphatidylinositol mannoside acyltransferase [Cellulomonadaceae bacterium]
MPNVANAFLFAWRYARYVPEPILRWLTNFAADVSWWRHGKGVRRLQSNYAKIRPDLSTRDIRLLAKAGMRSYARYYCQAFTLPAAKSSQINARVRAIGLTNVTESLKPTQGAIVTIGHFGNWDLAGAWVAANVGQVLTVAEKLNPPELYQEFLSFRKGIGLEVLGLGDAGVFSQLAAALESGPNIIALAADRDLTTRGVEVTLCGHRARVAAGPAALGLETGAPIIPTLIWWERLSKQQARRAGTPWGIALEFCAPIYAPQEYLPHEKQTIIAQLSQEWVNVIGGFLKEHTEDWHMLQKVFVSDLDPDRYAETVAAAANSNGD